MQMTLCPLLRRPSFCCEHRSRSRPYSQPARLPSQEPAHELCSLDKVCRTMHCPFCEAYLVILCLQLLHFSLQLFPDLRSCRLAINDLGCCFCNSFATHRIVDKSDSGLSPVQHLQIIRANKWQTARSFAPAAMDRGLDRGSRHQVICGFGEVNPATLFLFGGSSLAERFRAPSLVEMCRRQGVLNDRCR